MFDSLKTIWLHNTQKRAIQRASTIACGDYIQFQDHMNVTRDDGSDGRHLSERSNSRHSDSARTSSPIRSYPPVACLGLVVKVNKPGLRQQDWQYSIVKLGPLAMLPRLFPTSDRSLKLEEIDWARLSNVRFLLDRSRGLSSKQKRFFRTVCFGAPQDDTDDDIWTAEEVREAERLVGDLKLSAVQIDHSDLQAARCTPIKTHHNLMRNMRPGACILFHRMRELFWGYIVRAECHPTQRPRFLVRRSIFPARLVNSRPNIAQAFENPRNVYDIYLELSAIRGVVDTKYLQDLDQDHKILGRRLSQWDFVVYSARDSPHRYEAGWVIGISADGQQVSVWNEKSSHDNHAPIARIDAKRAASMPLSNILRVAQPAAVMLRKLQSNTKVWVLFRSHSGRRSRDEGDVEVVEGRVGSSQERANFGIRAALRQNWKSTGENRIMLIRLTYKGRSHYEYYERRNVFVSENHAYLRLGRFSGRHDPQSREQICKALLARLRNFDTLDEVQSV